MKRILLADDHEIVRNGLRLLINGLSNEYCIEEAQTCAEVMNIMASRQPHFLILDMFLSDGQYFTKVKEIVDRYPDVKILIYTMNSEQLYAKRFLQLGAMGFVSKNSSLAELRYAIMAFLRGDLYISPIIRDQLFKLSNSLLTENPIDKLSDRELEIAEYLIRGAGTKEIAIQLNLEITSVSTYRHRLFEKLKVENILELSELFRIYKSMVD